jgi:uncharacterized protein (TIRG00374 family)
MKAIVSWKFWTGLLISGFFLFLAVRHVDFREVGRAFEHASYWFLIPSIGANFIGLWIRSLRWKVLLKPIRTLRIRDLFQPMVIGFMANNLFPARLGEIIRAFALGRKTGVSKTASFATIVLERMFDGMTIILFLIVTVGFLNLPFPGWLRKASVVTIAGYLLLLSLLIALRVRTKTVMRLFKILLGPFPEKLGLRILDILKSFVVGLQMLQEWKALFITALLSIFLWLFPTLSIYYALLAAGIHLPLSASFFLIVVLCIGVAVPSAPGFIGTIQFVSVIGLTLFNVSRSQALSYSILFHLSQYIPVTALGLVFFFSEGLSFSGIGVSGNLGKDQKSIKS